MAVPNKPPISHIDKAGDTQVVRKLANNAGAAINPAREIARKLKSGAEVISKPDLPAPIANPAYKWQGHATAAAAETELARVVHNLPNEAVIRWGDKIGTHGSEVISVNMRTGNVTLWDSKFRSNAVRIQQSKTFLNEGPLANAINQALTTLEANTTLPVQVRSTAIEKLINKEIITRTVGMGAAKNSVLR